MGRRRQNNRKGNNKKTSSRTSSEGGGDSTSNDVSSNASRSIDHLFAIGTRVEVRKENFRGKSSTSLRTGTVAGHWRKQKSDGRIAPYLVLMDDGMALYAHRTEALIETTLPPMEVTYNIGSRVECQLAEGEEISEATKWFPGTIIQAHHNWAISPIDTPPYFVRFDYGRERPFWGPADRIREIHTKDKSGRYPSLRFGVGDRVTCYMDNRWTPGKIVQTWYREDDFQDEHAAPYQVLLDTGGFIYSPMDDDDCIMKCNLPFPELRFHIGDKVKCRVEGGWEPGIIANVEVLNGERLYPYGIKMDCNGEFVYAPSDSDMFIRKILRFKKGDRVKCYTEEDGWVHGEIVETEVDDDDDFCQGQIIPYRVRLDNNDELFVESDDSSCIKLSTSRRGEQNGFAHVVSVHVLSKMLINNEEYEEAKEMLQEKIEMMRSKIKQNSSHSNVAKWRVDLSHFLCYLSEVHQASGSLDEMKLALVEALVLTKLASDKSKPHRLLDVTSKLATHATLNGDKQNALKYSEEAILLVKETTQYQTSFRLGSLLIETGKLNIVCNMRERGLEQMSEGIGILDQLCGSDNEEVIQAKEEYERSFSEGKTDDR